MPEAESAEGRLASRMAIFLLSFLVAVSATGITLVVALVGSAPPRVILGDVEDTGGSYRFEVRSASNVRPLDEFAVALEDAGGTEAARLEPVVAWTPGPRGPVIFEDANRDGRMNPGDSFSVLCRGPGTYTLVLYREGALLDAVSYDATC